MFSSAVKLGDLNDFIAPSQSCVVSLGASQPANTEESKPQQPEGQVQLQPRQPNVGFKQTYSDADGGPIKVTLHDCLACSGCVTSAETVLLQHQSADEFQQQLQHPDVKVVVSVSPQSRASLAALHGISASEVQARLTHALKQLGVQLVLDIGPARDLALAEAAAEFLDRYKRSKEASTSAPAAATAAAAHRRMHGHSNSSSRSGQHQVQQPALPMLASACPGWIVYAEKTHGEYILPYLSTTKSPQAVMGTLVKRHLAPSLGWDPARVYHAAVMPCYDKKLEAVRDDFVVPGTSVPEVDCSLTTSELQELLEQHNYGQLAAAPAAALDIMTALLPHLKAPTPQPAGTAAAEAAAVSAPTAAAGAAAVAVDQRLAAASPAVGSSSDAMCIDDHQQQQQQHLPSVCAPATADCGHNEHQQQQLQLGCLQQSAPPSVGSVAALPMPAPHPLSGPDEAAALHSYPGSSGGYMQYIFMEAARELYRLQLPGAGPLATRVLRNADFQELSLQDSNGRSLLRFAAAYGFRNIQTLMRKIKQGRCEYDYVEVMACPSGCLNGAGQVKPRPGQTAAQLLEQLETLYYVPEQRQQRQQQQPEGAAGAGTGERIGSSSSRATAGGSQQAPASCDPQMACACRHPQQQQQQHSANQVLQIEPGVVTVLGCDQQQQQQQQVEQQQQQQVEQQPDGDAMMTEAAADATSPDVVQLTGSHGRLCRSAVAAALYVDWIGDTPGSVAAQQLLHTQYKHRQKVGSAAVSDW